MTDDKMKNDADMLMSLLDARGVDENSELTHVVSALVTLEVNFSDILIHEDSYIAVRMQRGWVVLPEFGNLIRSNIEQFLATLDQNFHRKLLPPTDSDEPQNDKKLNISRDISFCRIRCNAFIHGENKIGIAIRRIPKTMPVISDIGLPLEISQFAQRTRGLVLITGSVGSGKSTTMAALLNYINKQRCNHVITLEDPLEFIHKNEKSIFTHREIPKHVASFKEGFEEALRERPDVIAIGELRNIDTVDTCLEGSDAGLLMFATMHANSATSAINKFLNYYSTAGADVKQKAQQLADSLICVINQTLIPSTDGNGKMGYEILVNNTQVQSAISKMEIDKLRSLMSAENAMPGQVRSISLNQSLLELVKNKDISKVDALNHCYDKNELQALFNRADL